MPIILYPNKFTMDFLTHREVVRGERVDLNKHKVLNDFFSELIVKADSLREFPEQITSLCKHLMVKRAVKEYYDREFSGYYSELKEFESFSILMTSLIGKLQRNLIEPDQFIAAGEDCNDKILKKKILETGFIYRIYQNGMGLAFSDQESMNFHYARAISGSSPGLWGDKRLILRGFINLIPFHQRVFNLLEDAGFELELELNEVAGVFPGSKLKANAVPSDSPYKQLAKCFLNKSIPQSPNELPHIEVIPVNRIDMEVRAIGVEILELLRSGVRPSDIAVTFSDLSKYTKYIDEEFGKLHIPYYYRRGNPLQFSPLIRTVLAGLQLSHQPMINASRLFAFLNSNFIDLLNFKGGTEVSLYALEKLTREAGILEGDRSHWEKRLNYHQEFRAKKNPEYDDTDINLLYSILAYFTTLGKPKSFTEHIISIIDYLVDFNFQKNLSNTEEHLQTFNNKAFAQFIDALKEIQDSCLCYSEHHHGKLDELSAAEFYNMLEYVIQNKSINVHGNKDDSVYVLNAEDLKGLKFNHVFLGGMVEKEYPALPHSDPFFKEDEKNYLNHKLGYPVFELKGQSIRWQRVLFSSILESCKEKIHFSYYRFDKKGNDITQACYLDELGSIYGVNKDNELSRGFDIVSKYSYALVPGIEQCSSVREVKEGLIHSLFCEKWDLNEEDKATSLQLAKLIRSGNIPLIGFDDIYRRIGIARRREAFFRSSSGVNKYVDSYSGNIADEGDELIKQGLLAKLLTHIEDEPNGFWTQRKLSDYAKCPFRFFCSSLLKIKPVEFLGVEIDRMVEGSLYHEILQRYYQKTADNKSGDIPDECYMRKLTEQVIEEYEKYRYVGDPQIWEIKKSNIQRICELFVVFEKSLMANSGFKPVKLEWHFGRTLKGPPERYLCWEFDPECNISFTGVIDRVDNKVDEDGNLVGLRVFDYKSGKGNNVAQNMMDKNLERMIEIQIPLYMHAISEIEGIDPERLPDGFSGHYYRLGYLSDNKNELNNPKKVGEPFKGTNNTVLSYYNYSEKREHFKMFKESVNAMVKRAVDGDFRVDPVECEDYCPFKMICRYEGPHFQEKE
ncbi:PD-(D/E)XK nuclease family protein [bacterium]|nr:PD-(D/E)XK nuclease family protein [bacterium]